MSREFLMANKLSYGYLCVLRLCLIIMCFLLLGPTEAEKDQRKSYIMYMGDRTQSYVSAKTFYLNMIKDVIESESNPDLNEASEYLVYTYDSFQGCVARLTEKEAKTISRKDGVVSVFPNMKMHHHTTRSWDFMGFDVPTDHASRSNTESDVIVGVIDSGIWPESQSFSDKGFGPPPARWKGHCQTSHNFTCSNKIIGARYFRVDGNFTEEDIESPRDSEGHGTHTASTTAGGVVNMASFLGLGLGTARGGVPSARIAIYKACWMDGCYAADILAAFDAAIVDGVDIISASLGVSIPSLYFEDPVAIGAFHAMKNGILTSTSAGNDGPQLQTITSFAPWSLSVAASTIDRKFITKVKLGNGMVVEGISLNTFDLKHKTFPLIYAGDAQNLSSSDYSRSCLVDSLNRTLVKGKIVFCDSLIDGTETFLADAAGVIMQGLSSHDQAFSFPQPASYLRVDDATKVLSYIRNLSSTPYGTILKSVAVNDTSAPIVATFSSRGPNPISPGILKPDLTAPGVDIVAAWPPIALVADVKGDPRSVTYNIISGTSMSCPHATAVAAYVKSFYPTWSPAAIKSALMTTAFPMSKAANGEGEFAYGSGHINPLKAKDPGLVYDTEEGDYAKFLCSQGLNETNIRLVTGDNSTSCSRKHSINNWDLNYPSIALPTSLGPFDAIFNRTVTNVGSHNCVYKAIVSAPEGQAMAIKVHPAVLRFNSVGQKLSFTVRVYGTIGIRALLSGSLVWDDGEHQVRSPIVVYNLS